MRSVRRMCAEYSRNIRQGKLQTQIVFHLYVRKLRRSAQTSWLPSSQRSSKDHWNSVKCPPSKKVCLSKMTCCPHVGGNEVFLERSLDPCCTTFSSLIKQTGLWIMQLICECTIFYTAKDPFVKLKFADDTTVIGLISDDDESVNRKFNSWLSGDIKTTCDLNTLKTVETVVNIILARTRATVQSIRFLGSTISQDLKHLSHINSILKKVQQRLFFFLQLRKFNVPQELLTRAETIP